MPQTLTTPTLPHTPRATALGVSAAACLPSARMLRTGSSLRPRKLPLVGMCQKRPSRLRHPAAFYRKKTRNVAGEPVVARLIAVATHAQTHDGAKKLADLRPRLVSEIKEFFMTYNKPRTQIQVQGRGELEKASS